MRGFVSYAAYDLGPDLGPALASGVIGMMHDVRICTRDELLLRYGDKRQRRRVRRDRGRRARVERNKELAAQHLMEFAKCAM